MLLWPSPPVQETAELEAPLAGSPPPPCSPAFSAAPPSSLTTATTATCEEADRKRRRSEQAGEASEEGRCTECRVSLSTAKIRCDGSDCADY